jgi:hypothetical protein
LTDVSEVLTASIIRMMSKPHVKISFAKATQAASSARKCLNNFFSKFKVLTTVLNCLKQCTSTSCGGSRVVEVFLRKQQLWMVLCGMLSYRSK